MDNIFIERLWRSLKYEAAYLHDIADGFTARRVIGEWIDFYNTERPHPALGGRTPAEAYRSRWQVELFFKWIKQHLRIKSFFGTSENAVKNQIWIAISVYVLVAIIRKRLGLDISLHTILQILSLTPFQKMPLEQLLDMTPPAMIETPKHNFLNLLD